MAITFFVQFHLYEIGPSSKILTQNLLISRQLGQKQFSIQIALPLYFLSLNGKLRDIHFGPIVGLKRGVNRMREGGDMRK